MHIAMLQDDWWPKTGGGPVHVKELSIALAEEWGHEVDIYTRALKQDGTTYTDSETYADGAVTVKRVGPATEYWNPIGRLSSMVAPIPSLLSTDYDVIHGHTFLPAVPTWGISHLADVATVFTVHGTAINSGVGRDTSALAPVKRRLERQFILGFDYDHVISVNTEHLDLLGQHHTSLSCVPNGVNLERFDVDIESRNEILFLGRLAPKKRVSDLITAFAEIADEAPETELVIVGVGPDKKALESQANETPVADRITFTGRVSDEMIPRYYRRARLFVLPSVWEGHPLTLLEAWAAETPVITSDVEGITEFVEHDETGYLVSPNSPDELADALRYSLNNQDTAKQWAANAYELVEAEYSWEGVADQTDKIYREII